MTDTIRALVALYGLSEEQACAVAEPLGPVVVSAGAGTGKTTTMACRYVDAALSSARRAASAAAPGGPPPSARRVLSRLAAVTFTELAAAELRQRIAQRFRSTAARLTDRQLAAFANEAADLEGDLPIGTIHGLCARLLRDNAHAAGVAVDFGVLDALGTDLLWEESFAATVDRLSAEKPKLVAQLLAERQEAARLSTVVRTLATELDAPALAALAEEPLEAFRQRLQTAAVALLHRVAGGRAVRSAVKEARRKRRDLEVVFKAPGARMSLDTLAAWSSGQGTVALAAEPVAKVGATEKRCARLGFGEARVLRAFSAALDAFKRAADPIQKAIGDAALAAEHAWTQALLRLALEVRVSYDAGKRTRGVLDFDDLERHAEAALSHGRRRATRFDALLVDELQDTSPRQLAVLRALAGPELERIFAVGDPKQSIYRFRGADVAVFRDVARLAERPRELTVNRRSVPAVLALANAVSVELFPPTTPEDAPWVAPRQLLAPARPPLDRALAPLILVPWDATDDTGKQLSAPELRRRDAAATALAVRRLQDLARAGSAADAHDAHDASLRPPTEIAVLLRVVRGARRAYVDALRAAGVSTAVEAGGNFVRDATAAAGVALLRALALPGHRAAWAAVLRSPLVGLPEPLAFELARQSPWPELVADLLSQQPLTFGPAASRIGILLDARSGLEPLSARFRLALRRLAVRSRQLDKLAALVEDLELRGYGPIEAIGWLEALTADDKERRVPDPAGSAAAVRAMTIHAAKGLGLDVVVIPQLADPIVAASFQPRTVARGPTGAPQVGPTVPGQPQALARELNRAIEREREEAEQARLVYVALTRARNHVVLPVPLGLADDGKGRTAGFFVPLLKEALAARPAGDSGPVTLTLDGVTVEAEVWHVDAAEELPELVLPAVAEPRPARRGVVESAPARWPVTKLASLAYCPLYAAQAGLGAAPAGSPGGSSEVASGVGRGEAVHAWLAGLRDGRDALAKPPSAEAVGGQARADALAKRVAGLLDDPRLAGIRQATHVLREAPLEGDYRGVLLSGTPDLVAIGPSKAGGASERGEPEPAPVAPHVTIVEYKTGTTGYRDPAGSERGVGRDPEQSQAYGAQIAAYAVLVADLLGEVAPTVSGRIVFVDLGEIVCWDWTVEDARRELDRLIGMAHSTAPGAPNARACPECRLRDTCPGVKRSRGRSPRALSRGRR